MYYWNASISGRETASLHTAALCFAAKADIVANRLATVYRDDKALII